ncbi:MAG: YhjD/YihY/BrkB family envelope integrity protein [Halorhabdus sp.]
MTRGLRRTVGTGRAIVSLARTSRISFLAAATAYYAFVSVFPLVLLVIAVGSLLGGDALAEQALTSISGILSDNGQELVRETLSGGASRGGATVVGVGVLFWSGLRVFRGLTLAFATIYR